jgi:hypothetical protein
MIAKELFYKKGFFRVSSGKIDLKTVADSTTNLMKASRLLKRSWQSEKMSGRGTSGSKSR